MSKVPMVLAALLLAVLASSCNADWTQFGSGGPGNTRNTSDAGLAQATLPTLAQAFTGVTGAPVYSSPAVAGGVAYVTSDDGKLYAFKATSSASCSAGTPITCPALWTATIEPAGALAGATISSSPAVSGGVVYVGSTTGKLYAFDAAGVTNCSGSPKTCAPLWTATTSTTISSSPTVSGGVVYIASFGGTLYAFDAAGSTGCSGSPKTCTPLWTASAGGFVVDNPTVSGSSVFIGATDGKLYAFSSAGTTNCAGSPKVCTPLWTGATGASISYSSPAVSGGFVYVGNTSGVLSVFDAAGATGCTGAPKTCSRLWRGLTNAAIFASPAVSGSSVFVGSTDHKLYSFDAAGSTNCSGSPKICTPLWTATTGGVIRSSPVVAGATVAVGSDDHNLYAFDAAGAVSCAGSPKVCSPLWSSPTGAAIASSPSVAQGMVYVASLDNNLYAYKPWVFTRPTCPANPHSGLSPCRLQDAYRLPSQVAGKGRTVAIVDAFDNPNAEADLAVYRSTYGLPPCTTANGCFKKLNQSGVAGSYPAGDSGWGIEITLDLDAVSATCPLCNITLVEASDTSIGNLSVAVDTAAAQSPAAISNSYGASEFGSETAFDSHYVHPGIAITVSTGDSGFGTAWPAASPGVTAVGGTNLATAGNTRGWTETAWSGAGSGCSAYETKPVWQTDTAGCAKRTIADVSALAGSPGIAIYDTYGTGTTNWLDYGGTSLASPIVGSVYAMAAPVGASSYPYAHTSSLFDITSGNNSPSCGGNYLCAALAGFDGPTGLGTPCGTAAFGTSPFVTTSCPQGNTGATAPAIAPADTGLSTPACAPAQPGHVRCFARRIS